MREIATAAVVSETPVRRWTHRLDGVLLHPVAGRLILAADHVRHVPGRVRLGEPPVDAGSKRRRRGWRGIGKRCLPDGGCDRWSSTACSPGVGAVIVFLPQILILFLFILLLEGTGYMVRAAFLMDRLMSTASVCRDAPSSLCSRASPARSPASWRRARSTIPRTG